ncbi:AAA family ATPase [Microbacterium sp. USTB-Y]|uniref:AAA family ATPase n=1 Tax=Microbacterium sp. USTB-Y TaxID=2823692 RepID=UPI0020405D48|nr:AAA family ATPase [Microbacterium sp. USTB-Y]
MARELEAIEMRFPALKEHRRLLSLMGSQVIQARQIKTGPLAGCARLRIRFSEAIESAFGLTREVLAIYLPYDDFQSRSYEAALRELRSMSQAVTPDLILIWAPDERLSTKLAEWGTLQAISIPFQLDSADSFGLIELLQGHIHLRNLFETTAPVSGSTFFGRRTVLQGLREDVLSQRAAGIFGLRKAGKTSILFQLAEELHHDSVVPVHVDLEAMPSPPVDPTDDLLALLRFRITEALKARGLRVKELAELSDFPSNMQFKIAMQKLLRQLSASDTRILLMLDEIEFLTPSGQAGAGATELPRVAQVLATLRSLTQESGNMSLLLAGLTSSIVEQGMLHGRPNPFFRWARTIYVGPLEREDADDLALSLGRRMGIFIAEGAREALYEATGGHAYLYRNLASAVVKSLPVHATNRTMARRDVLGALGPWKTEVHGYIVEVIRHVESYYPAESVLLESVRSMPEVFEEFAAEEVEATRHLVELGLLEPADGGYRPAALLELR